jgi:hypothetical protein
VVQESEEITVRSRRQQQLEEKLRKEGTIGLVLGPLEAKGGGGKDTGSVTTSETETQFKVKLGSARFENQGGHLAGAIPLVGDY